MMPGDSVGPSQPKRQRLSTLDDERSDVDTSELNLSEGFHFVEVCQLGKEFNKNAFNLRNILSVIKPEKSAHFNFLVDLEFLIKSYPPNLRKNEILVVTGDESIEHDLPHLKPYFPKLDIGTAKLISRYGTHHTKLSLFHTEFGLHVIISTANLIPFDWSNLTQAFYYAYGEYLVEPGGKLKRPKPSDQFGDDLQRYLRTAYLSNNPGRVSQVQAWSDLFSTKLPDFSHVKDRLVYSVPGKDWIQPMGFRMLAQQLKKRPVLSPGSTLVAQCSSLGSLGGSDRDWLLGEFMASLKDHLNSEPKFCLMYPSMKCMAESVDGWEGAGAFPLSDKIYWREKWLKKYFCDWKSDIHGRSRCMPHIKTYTAISKDGVPEWTLLTSANLSKAAWGRHNDNGATLFVHSYELGVLIHGEDHEQPPILAYDWPLTRYSNQDEPFRRDLRSIMKDWMDRVYPYTP